MPDCKTCNDTRTMHIEDRGDFMCTHCPSPCKDCGKVNSAYCTTVPCVCACHRKNNQTMTHHEIQQLKQKLEAERDALQKKIDELKIEEEKPLEKILSEMEEALGDSWKYEVNRFNRSVAAEIKSDKSYVGIVGTYHYGTFVYYSGRVLIKEHSWETIAHSDGEKGSLKRCLEVLANENANALKHSRARIQLCETAAAAFEKALEGKS